jgi:hypothetical protein
MPLPKGSLQRSDASCPAFRIDTTPDHIAKLLGEMLVIGQLKPADSMRPKTMLAPEAPHRRDAADNGRVNRLNFAARTTFARNDTVSY